MLVESFRTAVSGKQGFFNGHRLTLAKRLRLLIAASVRHFHPAPVGSARSLRIRTLRRVGDGRRDPYRTVSEVVHALPKDEQGGRRPSAEQRIGKPARTSKRDRCQTLKQSFDLGEGRMRAPRPTDQRVQKRIGGGQLAARKVRQAGRHQRIFNDIDRPLQLNGRGRLVEKDVIG